MTMLPGLLVTLAPGTRYNMAVLARLCVVSVDPQERQHWWLTGTCSCFASLGLSSLVSTLVHVTTLKRRRRTKKAPPKPHPLFYMISMFLVSGENTMDRGRQPNAFIEERPYAFYIERS